jgi:hypothetical protein
VKRDELDRKMRAERQRKADARKAARGRDALEGAAGEISETLAARQRIAEARGRAARRHHA